MQNRKSESKVLVLMQSPGMRTYPEQSWVWSAMRFPVIEVRGAKHREVRLLGLSTWTDKSSRTMA